MCSTHPDGESALPALSCSLADFLTVHPDYLGSHSLFITDGRPELPILIKLIDAKADLSVQVHPDDEEAKQEGQWGKTEMWYVLDAKLGSSLIYGFNRDVEEEAVRIAVKDGSIGSLLNHVPVHRDDVFMVSPGTVHAIGAGILLAEIQQSSNLTYRLYDYGRVGKDGKQRELPSLILELSVLVFSIENMHYLFHFHVTKYASHIYLHPHFLIPFTSL